MCSPYKETSMSFVSALCDNQTTKSNHNTSDSSAILLSVFDVQFPFTFESNSRCKRMQDMPFYPFTSMLLNVYYSTLTQLEFHIISFNYFIARKIHYFRKLPSVFQTTVQKYLHVMCSYILLLYFVSLYFPCQVFPVSQK